MNGRTSNSLRSWPALFVAGLLACGITVDHLLEPGWFIWIGFVASGSLLLTFGAIYRRHDIVSLFPLAAAVACGLLAVAAGGLRAAHQRSIPADHVSVHLTRLAHREVRVVGRVASAPEVRTSGTRFDVQVHTIHTGGFTLVSSGKLQVRVNDQTSPVLPPGTEISTRGTLRTLPQRRNPADFDYGGFLRRRGVFGQLFVDRMEDVETLSEARPGSRFIAAARRYVETAVEDRVPSNEGRVVLRALLLGDRSGLNYDVRERFARSGLMHLLAVSGLHVLLVGMVLYRILRPTLIRIGLRWITVEIVRSTITIGLLVVYMLLTGSSPSVVRAVTMATLFIGSTLVQRPVQSLNTLGAAGCVLLLWRPEELFSAGFQLSFSAVGTIILYGPHLRTLEQRLRPGGAPSVYFGNSVLVSLAATLGTLPVLLYHFGRASFAGLILNVAAIPATFGILSSGLALVATHALPGGAASAFGETASLLTHLLMQMATAGDRFLEFAMVEHRVRNLWQIAAIVSFVGMSARWMHRRTRWRMMSVTLLCLVVATWDETSRSRPQLDILFFDVGQGDAALLRMPNGRTLLVDAGPRTFTFDSGRRVLHPNLEYLGLDRVDAVVISHPHSDHLGGLPHLLRNVEIGRLLHNGDEYDSELFREVEALIDSLALNEQALVAGDTLLLDPKVRIKVLAPAAGFRSSVNDRSVVLRIAFGDVSILLTGDAEQRSERLITTNLDSILPSTIIKAGHHGSSTSSTIRFVEATSPETAGAVAVVSVARRNRYRHPVASVLERWESSGREVLLTSREGAIWFRTDGRIIHRVEW